MTPPVTMVEESELDIDGGGGGVRRRSIDGGQGVHRTTTTHDTLAPAMERGSTQRGLGSRTRSGTLRKGELEADIERLGGAGGDGAPAGGRMRGRRGSMDRHATPAPF